MTLIDTLQHLGIGYHFEEEINAILYRSYARKCHEEEDLFSTSLRFRLLRQGGHNVLQDVFYKFMDEEGKFKETLKEDLLGLLSLHEASYLGARGEEVLLEAMMFSEQHLLRSIPVRNPSVAAEVSRSLAHPRHRRMERSEARNYIKKYQKVCNRSSHLLQLAYLDFNMVQRLYENESKELISWWRESDLPKKLTFARDRPLECFLWTVGVFPEPCFSRCRIEIAKAISILQVIDDIYDIRGSLEELVLFTDAVRKWESEPAENLPEYMKIAYMALYNTNNEIGYRILKEHGLYAVPHLKKTWIELCDGYLLEARWFRGVLVPPLKDYLHNGVTTGGTYLALVHAFFLMGKQVTKESLELVNSQPLLFTASGRILRLWDDLGTTKEEQERGDDASSINCYKKHNICCSDEDARNHVRLLIEQSWQDLNTESLATTPLPRAMIEASLNLARSTQTIYQHGDDDRAPSVDDCIKDLLIKPIHL